MSAQTMTPTQEHLFKLLLEIDDICKRHEIEYFLDSGTVLGAVRHGGFLPWDDDLDIVMTEPNYDKFVEACQAELDPKTRFYCDNRLNREYPTVFGHYIDTTCCRLTDRTPFWDYHCGQTIDVFCLMELPGNLEENRRISNLYFAYDEYVNQSFNHYKRKTEEINKIYHELYEREKNIGREAVLEECEKQIFGHHYDDCTMLMLNSAHMHWNSFLPKSIYDSSRMVEWNGHEFRIPGDWYTLMAIDYGDDFWQIPRDVRVHSQMSHTGYPVQAYIDDFMATTNKNELLAERLKAKNLGFENGLWNTRLNEPTFKALGVQMCAELDARLKASGKDLMDLVRQNSLEAASELEELLGDYFVKQTHSTIYYWRSHFGHSDAADCAILQVLLLNYGNVQKMIRLMQVRLQNGLAITDEMQRILDAGMHFRRMKKRWYYDELAQGCAEEQWVWDNLPHSQEVRVWHALYNFYGRYLGEAEPGSMGQSGIDAAGQDKLVVQGEMDGAGRGGLVASDGVDGLGQDEPVLQSGQLGVALEACLAEAQALHREFPDDDLATKLLADVLGRCGQDVESLKLMLELEPVTKNGFILKDVRAVLEAVPQPELDEAKKALEEEQAGKEVPKKKKKKKAARFRQIQNHLIAMAKELDQTCKELKVPYALCTHEAAWSKKRKGFYGSQYGIHVMMRAPHALKVKAALQAKAIPNRVFEDLSTNPELPFNHIRYVDTSTTVMDMSEDSNNQVLYQALGATITIHPLYTARPDVIHRRIEWGHQLIKAGRRYGDKPMSVKKKRALAQTKRFEESFGSKAVAKFLFGRLKKSKSGNKLYAYDAPTGLIAIDASTIDKASYAKFDKMELPYPCKLDAYVEAWCGAPWSAIDRSNWQPGRANRIKCISSPDFGYEDMLALFEKNGIDYRKAQALANRFFHWECSQLVPQERIVNRDYARARLSRDRIDMYVYLSEREADLEQAYRANDAEELRRILEEYGYLDRTERFYKNHGLGLFVTPKIFQYATKVWESEGRPEFAQMVLDCVPERHKSVDIAEYLAQYPRY